jgi:hypothetical protein
MKITELKIHLLEDRSDFVADKMGPALLKAFSNDQFASQSFGGREPSAIDIVQALKRADPELGKNIIWLARQYAAGSFRMEDLERIREYIELFLKNRRTLANKDLNSYSMEQLLDVIEPFNQPDEYASMTQLAPGAVSGESPLNQLAGIKNSRVIVHTPNLLVTVPQDLEASKALCKLHGKTQWCTQNTDMFADYSQKGPLFVLVANIGGKLRKFQYHMPTNQYKNAKDLDISATDIKALSALPEYTQFLNGLIKKYYGKYFEDNV